MSWRFIHAADIHLDSQLRGLAAYEGAPVEILRTASRTAFSNLVDIAIAEEVDFMIIAGDLYDGNWKDYNTGLFFSKEMARLGRAEIPAVVVYGNHDAESEITKQLSLPDNVKVFSSRQAETHRLDDLKVALHGRSFRNAATEENLAVDYPDAVDGWFNIGVLHTALEGHAAHARYAPCSLSELQAKGYDYWALGHVHEYRIVNEEPWVVFPGNLQGRHVREVGPRGAVMVSVEDGKVFVERLIVDVVRWHHLEVDAGGAASLDDVVKLVGPRLEALVDDKAEGRPMAVRVSVTGRSAAHGELFGLEPQLRAEILARANTLGDEVLWVEKVCVKTEPELDAKELKARSDAVADLQVMLERAASDEAFLQALADDLADLVTKAPKSLIDSVPELDAVRLGNVTDLVKAVSPGLLARLLNEE